MIEQFRTVLVVAAHPDDEIACSGTIKRLTETGAEVELIAFSGCDDVPLGDHDLRREWARALRGIGVNAFWMPPVPIPNKQFPRFRQEVMDELDEHRGDGYDLVLVPASSDTHQDHATVRDEAVRVFKRTTILGYEHPQNTVFDSRFSAYVSLSEEQVSAKLMHANDYRSQAGKPYMQPEYIKGLASVRGMQAGTVYAEAFEVIRWML